MGDMPGWYAAFKAKDARFDGHFFVGVSSTGIYCRPVCRAKLPKQENCCYYPTAAAAEQAGYRPCLLCRPELAPGTLVANAPALLAGRAAALLDEHCGNEQSLEVLAQRLGCTGRHLRRVFTQAYGVSPVQYLQTSRLLLAKSLLTDTELSVLEVAMAAGFGSLRRMNALFQRRYRLSPTALRRQAPEEQARAGGISLALGYRPPYPWQQMLRFLEARAVPGVELVCAGSYMRVVRLAVPGQEDICGWIGVRHASHRPDTLVVTVSATLLPVLPRVLARVRRMFDLNCDPDAVYEVLSGMNAIRPGLCVPGTRLPGSFDPFEMAVRAVLGQQITVRAARTLAARLVKAYGRPVQTGVEGLTHAFPSADDVIRLAPPIEARLGPLGIIATRARTVLCLAEAFVQGRLDFESPALPEQEMQKLLELPGIGSWTAQYIAMRAMGWPDAFLETDAGVKKALAPCTPKQALAMAEAWRPWRSYATINLWHSL